MSAIVTGDGFDKIDGQAMRPEDMAPELMFDQRKQEREASNLFQEKSLREQALHNLKERRKRLK